MPDEDLPADEEQRAETAPDVPAAPAAAPAIPDLAPAACGARLAELFPALFGAPPPKPIKLRIQTDIQARAPGIFTKKSLSVFLHRHTTSTAYLKALVAHTTRFDLDGVAAGELAEEHRLAAGAELDRRREIFEARRAAEREAQRATHREAAAAERLQRDAQRQQRDADFDARRERAALLRAFETTTLTRANFCALKRIADADLETALEQARRERAERPPPPPEMARPHGQPHGQPPRGRDDRPPRRERFDRPPGKSRPPPQR